MTNKQKVREAARALGANFPAYLKTLGVEVVDGAPDYRVEEMYAEYKLAFSRAFETRKRSEHAKRATARR